MCNTTAGKYESRQLKTTAGKYESRQLSTNTYRLLSEPVSISTFFYRARAHLIVRAREIF